MEEGSLRSLRVWIELLQQGAGVGHRETGAGGLPFLVRCLRPGAGTDRRQTQQSRLDKQRGASVSLSLARVGNGQSSNAIHLFFFFRFFDVDHFLNKVFIEVCNNTASVLCFHFLAKRHVES